MVALRKSGIYELYNGMVIGTAPWPGSTNGFLAGDLVFSPDGFCLNAATGHDVKREIVVGPGWMPWNGGENPAPGKRVEIINRGGTLYAADRSELFAWDHGEPWPMGHILAYRFVEEAAEPAKEDGDLRVKWQLSAEEAATAEARLTFTPLPIEYAATKLRPDLPDSFAIDKVANGGFIIMQRGYERGIEAKTLAALSNDADLLAWLTEQPA